MPHASALQAPLIGHRPTKDATLVGTQGARGLGPMRLTGMKPQCSSRMSSARARDLRPWGRPPETGRTRRPTDLGGAAGGRERGISWGSDTFVGPRGLERPDTIALLVAHERSHAHLQQWMNVLDFARLPSWFREELTTYASGGGGAEIPAASGGCSLTGDRANHA